MKITGYYPVLLVDDVAKAADFYQAHFGFKSLFASDWYIHLQQADHPNVNLAFVSRTMRPCRKAVANQRPAC